VEVFACDGSSSGANPAIRFERHDFVNEVEIDVQASRSSAELQFQTAQQYTIDPA